MCVLLERYRFWGKGFFQVAMTLPLCIPALSVVLRGSVSPSEWKACGGTIGIMTLSSFPLAYLLLRQPLKRLDRSLEEVSLSLAKKAMLTHFGMQYFRNSNQPSVAAYY